MSNPKNLTWEAWEFKHYPKNAGWYITLIAITVLIVAFFILVENDLFAAASLGIIAVLIIIFSRQTPKRITIELTQKGVKFGNLLYPYKQIKYFWVVSNERHKTVNFHTTAFINNVFILELEEQDPESVREFLLPYLPEHSATEETSMQKIMHRFKF